MYAAGDENCGLTSASAIHEDRQVAMKIVWPTSML